MKSIKDELNSNPNGFKYETLATDANIRKSVDDIVYGAYGEDNPHSLGWYSSNNTKAAISPEQYLSEERNKIMREYAKILLELSIKKIYQPRVWINGQPSPINIWK